MASGQSVQDAIQEYRKMAPDPEEPVHTEDRTIIQHDSSLYANITSRARDLTGLGVGDEVKIHSYRGFVVITPVDGD